MFDVRAVQDMVHDAVALFPTKSDFLQPAYMCDHKQFKLESEDYNITGVYTYLDSLQQLVFVIYLSDSERKLRMYKVFTMTVYADMFLAVEDSELADFADLLAFIEGMITLARELAQDGALEYLKVQSYGVVTCSKAEAKTVAPLGDR